MTSPVRNSMKQTATVERTAAGTLNPLGQPTPGHLHADVRVQGLGGYAGRGDRRR